MVSVPGDFSRKTVQAGLAGGGPAGRRHRTVTPGNLSVPRRAAALPAYWSHLPGAPVGSNRIRAAILVASLVLLFLAGTFSARAATGMEAEVTAVEPVELLTHEELTTLVAPVALYPDDLLAVVLPASTFPLQVVVAKRFLEARTANPGLEPDEEWDASIVALLNYPEILALLDEDLEWTWQLGEAVLVQQNDVIAAIADFRQTASAAGNLTSDDKQHVRVSEAGAIEITPVVRELIYVPYYDPQEVAVYQPRRVYHYYPRTYPLYYYPYASGHYFGNGAFWGVTSAFSIGWRTGSLHWHHRGFYDHPYYGYSYYDPFYYRRPHIWLTYHHRDRLRRGNRRHHGDNRWHNDDRYGGRRPGHRQRQLGGAAPPASPNGRPPLEGGRHQRPEGPAARGMERSVVAMPDKRSGHTSVPEGRRSGKEPGEKVTAAPGRSANASAPAMSSRHRASTANAVSRAGAVRRSASPGTPRTRAAAAGNRSSSPARQSTRASPPAAVPRTPRSAPRLPSATGRSTKAPVQTTRQPAVRPGGAAGVRRTTNPIRKPANVQRPVQSPVIAPRKPAVAPTPRRNQPARAREPAKSRPTEPQQRRQRPAPSPRNHAANAPGTARSAALRRNTTIYRPAARVPVPAPRAFQSAPARSNTARASAGTRAPARTRVPVVASSASASAPTRPQRSTQGGAVRQSAAASTSRHRQPSTRRTSRPR